MDELGNGWPLPFTNSPNLVLATVAGGLDLTLATDRCFRATFFSINKAVGTTYGPYDALSTGLWHLRRH